MMEYVDYIDSFIGIAGSFAFLPSATPIILPTDCSLKELNKGGYLDVKFFENCKEILGIDFGRLNDLGCFLVFKLPIKSEFEQMPKKQLHEIFVSSIDETIHQQLNGTTTNNHWRVNCCQTYNELRKNCYRCCGRVAKIFGTDIPEFSKWFQQNLIRKLGESDLSDVQIGVLVCEHGINGKLKDISYMLGRFKLEMFDEVAIHLARDYQRNDYGLFWKLEDELKFTGSKADRVFFSGMMPGICNFVFTLPSTKFDVDGEAYIRRVKPYSNLFKDFHRGTIYTFCEPFLSRLLNGEKLPRDISIQTIETWINTINDTIYSLGDKLNVSLRLECVVVIQEPDSGVIAKARKACRRIHDNIGNTILHKQIPIRKLKKLFWNLFLPLKHTILKLIASHKANSGFPMYRSSIDDVLLAAVCEALLCFFLYGHAGWRKKRARHDETLLETLGITASLFKKVSHNRISEGLKNCTNIRVVQDDVYGSVIEYFGPKFVLLKEKFGSDYFDEIKNLLLVVRNNDGDVKEALKDLIIIIYEHLRIFSKQKMFRGSWQQKTLSDVCSKYKEKDLTPALSREFSEWVVENSRMEQTEIANLIAVIIWESHLNLNETQEILIQELSVLIDRELYGKPYDDQRKKSSEVNGQFWFLYPMETFEQKWFVVVPLIAVPFGHQLISYLTLDDLRQRQFREQFEKIFQKIYGKKINDIDSHQIFKKFASLKRDTPVTIRHIFGLYFQRRILRRHMELKLGKIIDTDNASVDDISG